MTVKEMRRMIINGRKRVVEKDVNDTATETMRCVYASAIAKILYCKEDGQEMILSCHEKKENESDITLIFHNRWDVQNYIYEHHGEFLSKKNVKRSRVWTRATKYDNILVLEGYEVQGIAKGDDIL